MEFNGPSHGYALYYNASEIPLRRWVDQPINLMIGKIFALFIIANPHPSTAICMKLAYLELRYSCSTCQSFRHRTWNFTEKNDCLLRLTPDKIALVSHDILQ